jgi:hypothetical protein
MHSPKIKESSLKMRQMRMNEDLGNCFNGKKMWKEGENKL